MPEDLIDYVRRGHEEEFRHEAFEKAKARVPGDIQMIERNLGNLAETVDDMVGQLEQRGQDVQGSLIRLESASLEQHQQLMGQLRYLGVLLLAILLMLCYLAFR
jgi:type VI protein secretion system component VasF